MSLISRINDLAVRIADEVKLKQNKLVSGTNIKTINNESILGGGNMTIQGGSGGSSVPVKVVADQDNVSTIDLSQGSYFIADLKTVAVETPVEIPVQIVWSITHSFGSSTWGYIYLTGYQQQEGDILLLCVGSDGSTPALPGGFTNISNQSSGTEYTRTCYMVVGTSQVGSVYVSGVSTASVGILICLRNVNLDTLMSITPMITTGVTGMPNPGGITTTAENSVVLTVGYLDDDNLSGVIPPNDFTMIAFRASSTVGQTVMAASRVIATPQTVVPSAFGFIGSPMGTDEWVAVSMVFEPKLGIETSFIFPEVEIINAPENQISDVRVIVTSDTVSISWPPVLNFEFDPDFTKPDGQLLYLFTEDGMQWKVSPEVVLGKYIKRVAQSGNNIDWDSGAVFTRILSGTTTFTFSNLVLNKVITLILSGNHTVNLPSYCKRISGSYNGSSINYIQFHCTNNVSGSEDVWYVISRQAT